MKTWILVTLLFVMIGTSSCLKSGSSVTQNCSAVTVTAPASEIATLKAYIDSNHITAIQDSRGFFYKIDSTGTGTAHPTVCSDFSATYTGTLTNGKEFDASGATTPYSSNLYYTILGWQEAVPLMTTNSTMRLYLPPSLGYGAKEQKDNTGAVLIPANSILIFDIKLLAFN